jgi:hypothetical protein
MRERELPRLAWVSCHPRTAGGVIVNFHRRDSLSSLSIKELKIMPIAFDGCELREWLVALVEDGLVHFLSSLAEAVLAAGSEDY